VAVKDEEGISKAVTKVKTKNELRLSLIPAHVLSVLTEQHDDLYINPFLIDSSTKGQGLINLMIFLFVENTLLDVLGCEPQVFIAYFTAVMNGYRDNVYHNRTHAFDVTQTCNFFIKRCKFDEIASLT
jgi:hypothetical protein